MHSNRFFCGVVSLFGLCAAAFAQPANDRCENAAPLGLGTFLFANLGATNESPDNPCGLDGDVWYKFTAPDSGTVTITTCGLGSLDSVVALYVGECATRSYIDCNDDSDCGSGNTGHSTVQFTAHIGVSYLVRVGGYGTPRGTGALTVTLTPDATSQITYQGRLDMTSAPYTGPADLRFSLFDAATGGTQIDATSTTPAAMVESGQFTARLDFGPGAFSSPNRYLEIAVRAPAGTGSFVTLSPRQLITSAPRAISALKAATAEVSTSANSVPWSGVTGVPSNISGAFSPWSSAAQGIQYSSGNVGIGITNPSRRLDVQGANAANSGVAFFNDIYTGPSNQSFALWAQTSNPRGTAVFGMSNSATSNTAAIQGNTSSPTGIAVAGAALASTGVCFALIGQCSSPSGYAVYGNGRFAATGTKAFQIDHPLDPANKLLNHYCTEGPEPLNVYSGNTVTSEDGLAFVRMPAYFSEINKDERYLLTVIDDSDEPVLAKVKHRIRDGEFVIWTSKPHVQVSWRVEGVRNDAFVRAYGAPVEQDKTPDMRGVYIRPELFNHAATGKSQ